MSRAKQWCGITPAIRRQVLGEYGVADCHYCAFPATEVDHVVPRARGGGLDPENLVTACLECNNEKRDLTPKEWAAARRAEGKPWPVTSFTQRVAFLCEWGGRPWLEKVNRRTVIRDYEKFHRLLVDAREHDLAQLLRPARRGVAAK